MVAFATPPASTSGSTPWDAYNASDAFLRVLEAHGYQTVQATSSKITFTPPGGSRKERGQITFYGNKRALFCYCDSPHFEQSRGYDPTSVLTILEHGGDRRAACRALLDQGFGDRREATKQAAKAAPNVAHAPYLEPNFPSQNPVFGQLSAAHHAHLTAHAIAPEIIAQRGYETVSDPARLRALGFSANQAQSLPGLLIPSSDAAGETHYQYRPDRAHKDRPKYETPPGRPGRYGLDIPAACREEALRGTGELWLSEGAKKADAGASVGLCIVALVGVWMFLRENDQGRKQPLPDFDTIPLQGRAVVICYDSDAVSKPGVYEASRRLGNLLRTHGANVRFCYLPDDGPSKVGLDDYLAAGHTVEELRGLIENELRPVATEPIQALINGLNRQFAGRATFSPRRVKMMAGENEAGTLAVMKGVFTQQTALADECKFYFGDLYNAADLKHGDKIETLEKAIGKNNTANVRRWATVCHAFADDRDYFRDALPMDVLREIAGYTDEAQDALLGEYLQAEANNARPSREWVRARIRELDKLPITPEEDKGERLRPGAKGDALHLAALVRFMRPDTLRAFHELQDQHGEQIANRLLAAAFPDALAYAVARAQENAVMEEEDTSEEYAPSIYIKNKSARVREPEEVATASAPPGMDILDRPAAPAEHAPRHLTPLADVLTETPALPTLAGQEITDIHFLPDAQEPCIADRPAALAPGCGHSYFGMYFDVRSGTRKYRGEDGKQRTQETREIWGREEEGTNKMLLRLTRTDADAWNPDRSVPGLTAPASLTVCLDAAADWFEERYRQVTGEIVTGERSLPLPAPLPEEAAQEEPPPLPPAPALHPDDVDGGDFYEGDVPDLDAPPPDPALRPYLRLFAALEAGQLPQVAVILPDGCETRNFHNYVKEQRRQAANPKTRASALHELAQSLQAWEHLNAASRPQERLTC